VKSAHRIRNDVRQSEKQRNVSGSVNRSRSKCSSTYRGADKSLARPGMKQATAIEDFDVHISYLLS